MQGTAKMIVAVMASALVSGPAAAKSACIPGDFDYPRTDYPAECPVKNICDRVVKQTPTGFSIYAPNTDCTTPAASPGWLGAIADAESSAHVCSIGSPLEHTPCLPPTH